jgi:hypothetical protein
MVCTAAFSDRRLNRRVLAAGIAEAAGDGAKDRLFASELNPPRRSDIPAGLFLERGRSETRARETLGGNLRRVPGEACS